MPSHFKIKEYCPLVFRNLRERFGIDDLDYKESMTRWVKICKVFLFFYKLIIIIIIYYVLNRFIFIFIMYSFIRKNTFCCFI